ncbi:MAG TPA: hypothetical protein VIN73_10050 [Vicingaceae bacterium]
MKYIVFVLTGLVLFLGIFGCSNEPKYLKEESTQVTINTKVDTTQSIKIDITTETRHAYIKEVFINNSKLYIKADYVDYFIGDEAAEAEWRDKAYMIIDGDTMTGITDGYYISNQNKKLRTFKIQEGISIELIRTDDEVYNLDKKKVGNELQIRTYLEEENLIILHIEKGIVIGIEEQFIP